MNLPPRLFSRSPFASEARQIFRASALLLLFTASLSGCTWAVPGEKNFKDQAEKRVGQMNASLEDAFRCFLSKGLNGGVQLLYPETGFATWSFTPGVTYIALAEFKRISPTATEVTLWALNGGDWTVRPEAIWQSRVLPCMNPNAP